MKKELTRRDLIGRAGLALGGALTLGTLQACGSEDSSTTPPAQEPPATATPQVKDFPYEQHMAAGYQLDVAAVKEAAYQAYFAGGCCHGAFSALVGHLAATAGAPFDLLPVDMGKFGGGGIASYGSICGAILGSQLVVNFIVPDTTANASSRKAMLTDLMRWYERTAFPSYVPAAVNARETTGPASDPSDVVTLDFSAANLVNLQVTPASHLCHASVSTWCTANGVAASKADKLARCARLTADVAGKAAEMLNAYLASGAYGARTYGAAAASSAQNATCTGCHTPATTARPSVAAGMECGTCHTDKVTGHPALP